jgi:LacI family transcriptional regulator
LGESAARLLIENIRGGQSKRILLDNVLIVRETTGTYRK